jgi:hypothetical protein
VSIVWFKLIIDTFSKAPSFINTGPGAAAACVINCVTQSAPQAHLSSNMVIASVWMLACTTLNQREAGGGGGGLIAVCWAMQWLHCLPLSVSSSRCVCRHTYRPLQLAGTTVAAALLWFELS